MKDEDIPNLLGGYATGTLTPEERDLLFAAALKDQTLFNALADEQALRDLLDDPATRRRLLQSLRPAEPGLRDRLTAWMRSPAIWATAGVAVAVLALTVSIRRASPPPRPEGVEVARAIPAAEPPALRDEPKEERSARPAGLALKREAEAPAKMKVAVLEFDADPAQAKEALAASESIEKKLDSSGYAVIDRKRIDEALQAGNLNYRQLDNSTAAGLGRTLGADAVIVGSVKPAPPPPASAPSRDRSSQERAKVSARVEQVAVTATAIDTQNAASLAFAQGGQVDQVTSSLAKQIQLKTRASLEGLVTDVNARILTLGIGSKSGVKPGDRFELRRAGKPLGKVVINSVQDTFSVGTYDGADPAKTGDTATAE